MFSKEFEVLVKNVVSSQSTASLKYPFLSHAAAVQRTEMKHEFSPRHTHRGERVTDPSISSQCLSIGHFGCRSRKFVWTLIGCAAPHSPCWDTATRVTVIQWQVLQSSERKTRSELNAPPHHVTASCSHLGTLFIHGWKTYPILASFLARKSQATGTVREPSSSSIRDRAPERGRLRGVRDMCPSMSPIAKTSHVRGRLRTLRSLSSRVVL
jgi:hypothetical protein